jgi:hypothetical protein
MRTLTFPLLAAGLIVIACDSPTPMPTELKVPTTERAVGQGNGVQHRVSVGSHDFTPPGVDANFSLIAIQHRDGSVTGQWSDQFGHGNGGYHIAVDCLAVTGNQAWISGILTQGPDAFIGRRFATRVADNGTSANDPPDQISFSIGPFPIAPAFDCHTRPPFPLFPLDGGEVKVD